MTQFTKENLIKDGEFLMYAPNGIRHASLFVARFKYGRSGLGSMKSFLIKFFTVDEYFARLEAGEAPLTIVESKGYILPHIKRWASQGDPTAMAYVARVTDRHHKAVRG